MELHAFLRLASIAPSPMRQRGLDIIECLDLGYIVDEPRNATCAAASDAVEVFALAKADFKQALETSASFKSQIQSIYLQRQQQLQSPTYDPTYRSERASRRQFAALAACRWANGSCSAAVR